jgi:hypothetical protein
MAALVLGAGAAAQAQEEEPQSPVIQIGKADEGENTHNLQNNPKVAEQPQAPKYWIGLAGGAIPAEHVLRAHIDLPEGHGLLVASVVPDSPAAKAGVKQHDILLRANDVDLKQMEELVDLVLTQGEKKAQITLEVLRHGNRETIYLTPEERPADAARPQIDDPSNLGFGQGFGEFGPGVPGELMQQFRGRFPMEFRNFGPGVIVGGGQGVAELPNGVAVNITKTEGEPTRITVKRGNETWEVVGDDPESLKKLPEDLRPAVEQMLRGASPMDLHVGGLGTEIGNGRLQERLERMEKRMQEMMERLQQDRPANDPAQKGDQTN